MNKRLHHPAATLPLLYLLSLLLPFESEAGEAQVFATGLLGPIKLDLTERDNLVVSERGTGANDGRVSYVDRRGNARPLVSGLPSGFEVTNQPSGPAALQVRGCCLLELAIGEGDTLDFAPSGPPSQVPNALGASSPIFSSVLRMWFDTPLDELTAGFELTRADHDTLADGFAVRLESAAGENVWVWLVADLKDFRPDPATNVRGSNPFGIAPGHKHEGPLLADGGGNSLIQLRRSDPPRTLLRFAPVSNPPGAMPPVSDAVPTSIRHYRGEQYLVTLFGGVPFADGAASVRLVDVGKRRESELIRGLTSAIDVLPIGGALYVLEMSTNLGSGAPGQLLRFAKPSSEEKVVVGGLLGATNMVYSRRHRAFYVTELFANRVSRIVE
jgi:hypothetical protein